jgi:methionyl-tRNA synthetase
MYYITTPIPYANGKPHLGHLLEAITTDVFARFFRRIKDGGVKLQMGVDQNGLKIWEKARESGQDVNQYVEDITTEFTSLWQKFGIQYDSFVETSKPEHKVVTQVVWNELHKKGLIYKKTYNGLYCVGCEDFYAQSQLIDGKCPIHKTEPVKMAEENYFFALSKFNAEIKNFLQTADIRPHYISKEYINFVEKLEDISITREKTRLPWGVDVPGDSGQVMYVWFEALINYFTAAVDGEVLERAVEFPYLEEDVEGAILEEIHEKMPIDLMYAGKEIAKFHVVVFIGMLAALDLPFPKQVLVHGLINDSEGRKFSKSLGNGVFPNELTEKFGVDGTRYIMLHDINIDGDTNFDWKTIIDSYNSGLANTIGNLLMRVTTLIEKHLNGIVDLEAHTASEIYDFSSVYNCMIQLNPKQSIEEILNAARWGNELLEQTKPWTLIKEGKVEEAREILTKLAILLRKIGIALSIFLPDSGEIIHSTISREIITKAEPLFSKVELEISE